MYNNYTLYIFRSKFNKSRILYSLIDDIKGEYIYVDITNINVIFNYFNKNNIDLYNLAIVSQDPHLCCVFSRNYIKNLIK